MKPVLGPKGGWSVNDRALAVLARAALSEDPEVRNATEPGERPAA
jgi:hypothetical protein